jgi:hypothetical protein
MRKQDRVAQQQQSRPQEPDKQKQQPGPREQEQVKGGASQNQPRQVPRQGGRLPLPD